MGKSAAQKRRREAEADQEHQASLDDDAQPAPQSKKPRLGESRSLFVRSLPPNATNETLTEFFSQHFPVKHSTVVIDPKTNISRGYGFVTFTDADDALEAKATLDNELLDGRRLRLDVAEPRQRASAKDGAAGPPSRIGEEKRQREEQLAEARKLPKLIVRNLPWTVKSAQDLTALFQMYGKVKFADLPKSKGGKLSGFGFVTLRGKKNAERALEGVNGKVVDGRTLAVDWAVDRQTWEQQKDADDGAEQAHEEPSKLEQQQKQFKNGGHPEERDEDEDMDDADADLQNFMKNHMDNLEDEDSADKDGEADEDWEDQDSENETERGKKALSTDNSSTIFVRNLPFTATDEELKTHFNTHFGAVRYARVVMDRATDRPAGTGFVCFYNIDDLQGCLRGAPRPKSAVALRKHTVLQDETIDQDGKYTMDGRVLQVAQAVSKEDAGRLASAATRDREQKDKRRLYLLSEGTIPTGSPLSSMLPPAEVKTREASANQRRKLIESNPSLHLSLTRLAIRNIPRHVDSKALKALARQAVVGFAKDVKEGRRQPLSKEEIIRGGQEDREAEHRRKERGKGVVQQAKIIFESKEGSKVAEVAAAGKSRGYGFVEYSSHRWALMGLRWLNGHALKTEAGKTLHLIAEFAIENANVVSRRRANEARARDPAQRAKAPTASAAGGAGARAGKKSAAKGKQGKASATSSSTKEKKKGAEEDGKSEPKKSKAEGKLAQRQQVIGRKRMVRKKKAEARGRK